MITDPNINPSKADIKLPPDLAHLFRNLFVLGTPLSKPHEFLTFGYEMPNTYLTPVFVDRMERGRNYFWKCIDGNLYVDCGGHQYKINTVSTNGTIWPIQERINYAEKKADGTINVISEPTVILPDEEEFTLEIEEVSQNQSTWGILAVNGMYQQSGSRKLISPYYTYLARPKFNVQGELLINAPIPRGKASVQITETDGKREFSKAFKNRLSIANNMLHGVSVRDPSQLGFGSIDVAIVPCDIQVKTPMPFPRPTDDIHSETTKMSAASDLVPGSILGTVTEGEQLEPRTSEAAFFRIRVRTDLNGIKRGKYQELDTLLDNLSSLTCRCTHCGREATADIAHVVISDEGVLQVEQVAPCQGCQARRWEAEGRAFAVEIKTDAENGTPIPMCTYCGSALPGATVGPEEEIINAPHECPGCRSTDFKVENVPVVNIEPEFTK